MEAMKSTSCEECEAITLEYRRAWLDFWLNASDETRDACRALWQLVAGGSEAHRELGCRNCSVHLGLQRLHRRGTGGRRLTSAVRSIRLDASPLARAHHGCRSWLTASSSISSKVVIT